LGDFYAALPANTSVLGLSPNPQAGFPYVVQDHLVWASRSAHLWLLPAVQQNDWYRNGGPRPRKLLTASTMDRIAAMQRQQVVDDLTQLRPLYIVIPRCPAAFDCEAIDQPGFDILAWFRKDPSFAAVWTHYHYLRPLNAPADKLVYDAYALDTP